MRPALVKKYHHGDLRPEMVSAAMAFLKDHEPRDLSIRALAKQIGVSEAAPYHHFPNRKALELAVMAEGYGILRRQMEAAHAKPGAQLTDLLRQYVVFATAHPNLFHLIHQSGDARNPSNRDLYAQSNAAFAPLLETVRDRMAPNGATEDQIAFAALMTWTQVHGLAEVVLSDFLRLGTKSEEFCEKAYAVIDGSLEMLARPHGNIG